MINSPPSQPLTQQHWRHYAIAALPLSLLGLMPWWTCLLLCLLYALAIWSEEWANVRLLGSLLIVTVAQLFQFSQLGNFEQSTLVLLGIQFLVWLISVTLINIAANSLQNGQRSSLLLIAGVGLLAPQPGLLMALAGGALARSGRGDKVSRDRIADTPSSRWLLIAFIGLLALMSLALPRANLLSPLYQAVTQANQQLNLDPVEQPTRPKPKSDQSEDRPTLIYDENPKTAPNPQEFQNLIKGPPLELILAGLFILTVILAFSSMMTRGKSRFNFHPLQIIAIATIILLPLVWFISMTFLGLGPTHSIEELQQQPAVIENFEQSEDTTIGREKQDFPLAYQFMVITTWIATILLLLISIILAYFLWKTTRAELEDDQQLNLDKPLANQTPEQAEVLHRVRVAYAQAEEALMQVGHARLPAETPKRFATRLGERFPALSEPLAHLAALYEPVRYGGHLTEDDAEKAEQASEQIQQIAQTLPKDDPTDEEIP